jgi:HlyD family secretion protein
MMNSTKSLLSDLRIEGKARRTKRSFPIRFFIVLFLVVAGAFVWWRTQIWAPEVRTVMAMASDTGPKTVLNASGYVVARRAASCGSKATGLVAHLLIEEGMRVKAGDVLASLDDSDTLASLNLAKAQLDAARSAIEQIKVQSDLAEKNLVRETLLSKTRVDADNTFDGVKSAADGFRAQLKLQQAQIVAAERQVAVMQAAQDDMTIRAPFSGVVTTKNAQPGEMISPFATTGETRTALCTIVDADSLEIEVEVNEDHLNKVTPGQPVIATLDAYPDWPIQAKVRIKFKTGDPRILNQMEVRAAFLEPPQNTPRRPGVLVPRLALRDKDGNQFVWIVNDGHAKRQTITVADYVGDQVLVSSGLKGGEAVVVDNRADLSEGARIKQAKL